MLSVRRSIKRYRKYRELVSELDEICSPHMNYSDIMMIYRRCLILFREDNNFKDIDQEVEYIYAVVKELGKKRGYIMNDTIVELIEQLLIDNNDSSHEPTPCCALNRRFIRKVKMILCKLGATILVAVIA